MTTERDQLDDLFADLAGSEDVVMSDALEARIMADAQAVLAARPQPASLWARIAEAIGGWPAAAGLAAAGVAGVWMGVAPPDGALAMLDPGYDTETIDILGASALFAEEG